MIGRPVEADAWAGATPTSHSAARPATRDAMPHRLSAVIGHPSLPGARGRHTALDSILRYLRWLGKPTGLIRDPTGSEGRPNGLVVAQRTAAWLRPGIHARELSGRRYGL